MITKFIFLGILTITSYRPIPQQTKADCINRYHCTTSTGENVSELGVAVSQDLLLSGKVKYGDVLYIPSIGYRIVNDCMNSRHKNSVDIFVYTWNEEHKIGTRRNNVYLLRSELSRNY